MDQNLSRIPDQAKLEAEIAQRIRVDSAYFGGELPSSSTIAWAGYVAALLEWGLIGVASHRRLMELLPSAPEDAMHGIFLGRDGS